MSHQNLLTPLAQPKTTKLHDSHPTQLSDLNNNPNMKFLKYILQLINGIIGGKATQETITLVPILLMKKYQEHLKTH